MSAQSLRIQHLDSGRLIEIALPDRLTWQASPGPLAVSATLLPADADHTVEVRWPYAPHPVFRLVGCPREAGREGRDAPSVEQILRRRLRGWSGLTLRAFGATPTYFEPERHDAVGYIDQVPDEWRDLDPDTEIVYTSGNRLALIRAARPAFAEWTEHVSAGLPRPPAREVPSTWCAWPKRRMGDVQMTFQIRALPPPSPDDVDFDPKQHPIERYVAGWKVNPLYMVEQGILHRRPQSDRFEFSPGALRMVAAEAKPEFTRWIIDQAAIAYRTRVLGLPAEDVTVPAPVIQDELEASFG